MAPQALMCTFAVGLVPIAVLAGDVPGLVHIPEADMQAYAASLGNAWEAPSIGLRPGRFAGQVCFITGATSGLGEHAAYHLAREGCAVVVTGRRLEKAQEVVKRIATLPDIPLKPPALALKLDVTKPDTLKAATEIINKTYGRLDAVFVNSGSSWGFGPVETVKPEDFASLIDLNLNGAFYTVHFTVPLLKQTSASKNKSKGSISLCSSVYGLRAHPMMLPYVASKHALQGMAKGLAQELIGDDIRVNTVNPSYTPSELTGPAFKSPTIFNKMILQMQGGGKLSQMGDVSAVVAYMLSSDSSYITGHNFPVDGGLIGVAGLPASQYTIAVAAGMQELTAMAEAAEAAKAEL